MTFKDILPDDDFELLNLDEMGELVKLDGVILKAVVEKNTAKKSGNDKKNFKMLFGDFTELFFRKEDYCRKRKRLPRQGEVCYLYSDEWQLDKRFVVESCADEFGMAHLVLSAYRQNNLREARTNILDG